MIKSAGDEFKLLIVIIKKNLARNVIQACKDGGAEGGTVMPGRGTGTHETSSVFGVQVEPEKEIIFSIVRNEVVNDVIDEVTKAADLNKPGTGIAFLVNSKSICGVAHLLDDDFNITE